MTTPHSRAARVLHAGAASLLAGAMVFGLTTVNAAPAAAALEVGDSSAAVQIAQLRLGVNPPTGYYGSLTRAAVLRFQRARGIDPLGFIGPRTWRALSQRGVPAGHVGRPIKAPYRLTSRFGDCGALWASCHTGLDMAAPTGINVTAAASGTIVSAGWAGAYGYRIVIRHKDGTSTWYCHLSRFIRRSGAVTAGQHIAEVGATGNTTGPHLHFEVRPRGGVPINPQVWFAAAHVGV